jgi:glycosyltransferase involved in cell wall biosynthesis
MNTSFGGTAGGQPLVSIVIPTFNRPQHVLSTINSVLLQSYSPIEVIVQDNASDVDLTVAIEQLQDPRVRYFRNERNLGQTRNFALGLSRAKGEFIGLLADDDLIAPTFVEELVRPLIAHPDAVLAFCDWWVIDDTDTIDPIKTGLLGRYFGTHAIAEGYYPDCEVFALQYRMIGIMSSSLLRRSAADWANIPDGIPMLMSDLYYMYLAARTRRGCCYVPNRLTYMNYSANTITSSLSASVEGKITNARDCLRYWTLIHQDGRLSNRKYYHLKRAHYAALLSFYLLRAGRWTEAAITIWNGAKAGLFVPRSVFEHFSYKMDLRRAGLERKLLP